MHEADKSFKMLWLLPISFVRRVGQGYWVGKEKCVYHVWCSRENIYAIEMETID